MGVTRNISDDTTLAYLLNKKGGGDSGVKEELDAFKAEFLNMVYPVGSIYTSVNSANPQDLFGGTWERITGRFLLAATDNGAAGGNSNASIAPGYTGGEEAHTLALSEAPSHSHTVNNHTHVPGSGLRCLWYNYSATGNKGVGETGVSNNGATTKAPTVNASNVDWIGHDTVGYTAPGTNSQGGGGAHNNMPPYLAVYVWKRTA